MAASARVEPAQTRPAWGRAGLAFLLAVFLLAPAPASAGKGGFVHRDPSGLQSTRLYDLGVADANDDGNLDLFTTNHKFPSSLLLGDGTGRLSESRVALGLSPTPAFPGYEELRRDPDQSAPGLYLFATDLLPARNTFVISTTSTSASGRLVFNSQTLHVAAATNATSDQGTLPDGRTFLDFDAAPGARIEVVVQHIDLPIDVHVNAPTEPGEIRVGADAVAANTNDFSFALRDRHGFAFADFDGNGSTDLFISTGGLAGEIADPYFLGRQSDELLLSATGSFRSAIDGSGLVKGACRGRATAAADFNADGNLDLLESCEEAAPQIYLGSGAGTFVPGPAPRVNAGALRVVDLLGGRRPEIVATDGARIEVWRLRKGTWSLAQTLRGRNGAAPVAQLALGDFDADGDPDLFDASPGGNALLENVGGRLRARNPRRLGLPRRGSVAASFVDFDNDGDLDLDLLPQGLQKARGNRASGKRFISTGRLAYPRLPNGPIGYGVLAWPDLDGDGRRDPISARSRGEFAHDSTVDVRRSRVRSGHWLELDLVEPPGNAQAIGASVRVQTARRSTYGWVGQSESSHLSSGHYRLYFGLGRERRVERLVIRWPDGLRQVLRPRQVDHVRRVVEPDAGG